MKNKYNPSVSLEKFSAYLDGNLSSSSMEQMSALISNDDVLLDMVKENLEIEDAEDYYSDSLIESESIMCDENFELPNIEDFSSEHEINSGLSDIWLDSEASNLIDEEPLTDSIGFSIPIENSSQTDSERVPELVESSNSSGNMKGKVNYGYEPNHSESTFDLNIYQGNQPSCAIRSQEIILRDYGISIPQEELIKFATENGWYSPDPENGGTPRDATGNILDAMGVETKRYDNANIYDIISELRAGHRVIVSVDADELWVKNEPNLFKRLFGELNNKINDKLDELSGVQGANHALIVGGVNVNPDNPSDIKVVLIDSGSGDVCIEYSFKDFKKAWDDSHHHMVTTTEPAPFQYNYHTHEMEPSNFNTDFIPSMVTMPTGLQNEFHLPAEYYSKYEDYSPMYEGAYNNDESVDLVSTDSLGSGELKEVAQKTSQSCETQFSEEKEDSGDSESSSDDSEDDSGNEEDDLGSSNSNEEDDVSDFCPGMSEHEDISDSEDSSDSEQW